MIWILAAGLTCAAAKFVGDLLFLSIILACSLMVVGTTGFFLVLILMIFFPYKSPAKQTDQGNKSS